MVSHHNTISGARAKACRAEIKTAQADLKTIEGLEHYPGGESHQEGIRGYIQGKEQETEDLQLRARLEDLHVFRALRTTKKGNQYEYWFAEWKNGSKVKTVYLGSCRKVSREQAQSKARALKAEFLGLNQDLPGEA